MDENSKAEQLLEQTANQYSEMMGKASRIRGIGGVVESLAIPSQTFKQIAELAVTASGAVNKVVIISDLPDRHHYGVVNGAGELELRRRPRKDLEHKLLSVSEISPFVEHAMKSYGEVSPVLWVNHDGVVIVIGNPTTDLMIDTARVKFEKTEQFKLLEELDGAEKGYGHKDFIRLLRTKLFDAMGTHAERIVRACRSIKFVETTNGRSSVQAGRESLGRDFDANVSGADEQIPETILFSIPVFRDPALQGVTVEILCNLDVDVSNQRFVLEPVSGRVDNARFKLLNHVQSICAATGRPTFIGSP